MVNEEILEYLNNKIRDLMILRMNNKTIDDHYLLQLELMYRGMLTEAIRPTSEKDYIPEVQKWLADRIKTYQETYVTCVENGDRDVAKKMYEREDECVRLLEHVDCLVKGIMK